MESLEFQETQELQDECVTLKDNITMWQMVDKKIWVNLKCKS